MRADIELIILPYDVQEGRSLLQLLVGELRTGDWTSFRAAVAFAKQSGNYQELLSAMDAFLAGGGSVELTFGADVFGPQAFGSEEMALRTLLSKLQRHPRFSLYLYHERGRTFHPKLYLFAHAQEGRALAIVGSSNWSYGGWADNVEMNVLVKLDFQEPGHREMYERLAGCFEEFWKEQER